jgi:hypothetical protein
LILSRSRLSGGLSDGEPLRRRGLVMEYGGDTLSHYEVSFAPCETKPVSVTNPRLFPTKHVAPQLKLFALDEALGEGGWLKAFGPEAYAPRSGEA